MSFFVNDVCKMSTILYQPQYAIPITVMSLLEAPYLQYGISVSSG